MKLLAVYISLTAITSYAMDHKILLSVLIGHTASRKKSNIEPKNIQLHNIYIPKEPYLPKKQPQQKSKGTTTLTESYCTIS